MPGHVDADAVGRVDPVDRPQEPRRAGDHVVGDDPVVEDPAGRRRRRPGTPRGPGPAGPRPRRSGPTPGSVKTRGTTSRGKGRSSPSRSKVTPWSMKARASRPARAETSSGLMLGDGRHHVAVRGAVPALGATTSSNGAPERAVRRRGRSRRTGRPPQHPLTLMFPRCFRRANSSCRGAAAGARLPGGAAGRGCRGGAAGAAGDPPWRPGCWRGPAKASCLKNKFLSHGRSWHVVPDGSCIVVFRSSRACTLVEGAARPPTEDCNGGTCTGRPVQREGSSRCTG